MRESREIVDDGEGGISIDEGSGLEIGVGAVRDDPMAINSPHEVEEIHEEAFLEVRTGFVFPRSVKPVDVLGAPLSGVQRNVGDRLFDGMGMIDEGESVGDDTGEVNPLDDGSATEKYFLRSN